MKGSVWNVLVNGDDDDIKYLSFGYSGRMTNDE